MRFLITGTAGFIGFHLARRLIADGHFVCGVDGMTPYYDVRLKQARHAVLARSNAFTGACRRCSRTTARCSASPRTSSPKSSSISPRRRASATASKIRAPMSTPISSARSTSWRSPRRAEVEHFLIASTSSVYGANAQMPFKETDRTDHPLTLYAATKKATEEMAHSYAHLWKIPTTAFRFFTVYGPWGRPDMALFKFVEATLAGEPIDVYGNGQMQRDFTYIDDLVEAIVRLIDRPPREGEPVGDIDSLSPVGALSRRQYRRRPAGRPARLYRRRRDEPRHAGAATV